MTCDYRQLPHPGIQTLHPYIPGKSIEELAREQGLSDIIKLASNENALGCSPLVKAALANLTTSQIASYPSPANHPLLAKLSQKLAVAEKMLTLGNGTDTLFSLLLTTFALHRNKHLLTHDYAFISYEIQAQTLGIPVVKTPLLPNWQVDVDALINACNDKTGLIFLANPNNPTGSLIDLHDIERLLTSIPATTLVVLDEAYYEYSYPTGDTRSIQLLARSPNLVLTRTFSKAYGLAGLRLGYTIASPVITELLLRAQLPFVVNQAVMQAAYAALDDVSFIEQSKAVNVKGMEQIRQGLEQLNLMQLPSHANFITFACENDALAIYQALLREGIIIRPLHPYGLAQYLRVTIGITQQNARFLDKLAVCLAK